MKRGRTIASLLLLSGLMAGLAGCEDLHQLLTPQEKSPPLGRSVTTPGPAYRPTQQAAEPDPALDWASYNRTLRGNRFSPLTQIDTGNVNKLRPRCAYTLPHAVNMQSGLLEIAGTIYVTTRQSTFAIDAATCALRWQHVYHLARHPPFDPNKVNRGLAYAHGRLIRGSNDGRLYALNAATGRTIWNVPIGSPAIGETFPAAPIAWHGLVFIGNAGGDNFGVKGRMMAFDAATGAQLWSTPTLPADGRARETWPPSTFHHPQGGGATWTTYAIDPRTGMLFIPTGNAAPDFLPSLRKGADFYTYGVLGMTARTGTIKFWHQFLNGDDFHDWDMAAPPELITTRGGRRLLVAAGKDGYLYALDRNSGKLVLKVAVTTIYNAHAPLTTSGTRFCPGIDGGIEWNGPAYSPLTDAFYVNAVDWCVTVKIEPPAKLQSRLGLPWTGSNSRIHPYGLRAKHKSGWLTAVNAHTGTVLWRYHAATPLVAGVATTAGGLVFTGTLAGQFLAFDAKTGAILYQYNTHQPIGGGVISYQTKGLQYIAVASGMNSALGWQVTSTPARIIVFNVP